MPSTPPSSKSVKTSCHRLTMSMVRRVHNAISKVAASGEAHRNVHKVVIRGESLPIQILNKLNLSQLRRQIAKDKCGRSPVERPPRTVHPLGLVWILSNKTLAVVPRKGHFNFETESSQTYSRKEPSQLTAIIGRI